MKNAVINIRNAEWGDTIILDVIGDLEMDLGKLSMGKPTREPKRRLCSFMAQNRGHKDA